MEKDLISFFSGAFAYIPSLVARSIYSKAKYKETDSLDKTTQINSINIIGNSFDNLDEIDELVARLEQAKQTGTIEEIDDIGDRLQDIINRANRENDNNNKLINDVKVNEKKIDSFNLNLLMIFGIGCLGLAGFEFYQGHVETGLTILGFGLPHLVEAGINHRDKRREKRRLAR